MALDFSSIGSTTASARGTQTRTSGTNQQNEQRPQAKVWANIGYEVAVTNNEGNEENRFVSLPVNLPIDTMEPVVIRGQNVDYNNFQSARNDLLSALIDAANQLQPGEGKIINLKVQLFKRNEAIEPTKADENPFGLKHSI